MPASIGSPEPVASKSEKKHKREKSSKSEKKRAREEDAAADGERRHKKSKSVSGDKVSSGTIGGITPTADALNGDHDVKNKEKKKKEKKSKHGDTGNGEGDDASAAVDVEAENKTLHKKKKKKEKKEKSAESHDASAVAADMSEEKPKKKKKKSDKHIEEEASQNLEEAANEDGEPAPAEADAMDIDEPAKQTSPSIYQPTDIPPNPQFPFYTQTVSLYEPLYPIGWAQPITNCEYQYLRHLKDKYVPALRGVLMDYRNVTLGENPGRKGAAASDDDASVVKSLNEYAVGFGWITADVDLFLPSRGAWMEGSVNLQTEGHIGVVCFGKFNGSIEARRLPSAWKWISNEDPEAQGMEETASVITADDHGVVRQIHSTGFWVDGSGEKIKGKIRFRIRNFDVGVSGETSYLSLEGTMLDKESEKKLVKEEARMAALRKDKRGGRKLEKRRAPEFAMTRFTDETEQTDAHAYETPTTEPLQ